VDLRRNISYVPQDINLFRGDVKSNILSRAPYGTDEQLLKVARISGVEEFIKLHPSGFGMSIAERSGGLSGGQRQSVGIARALMIESPLVLFDEPTNAMDQLSESRLMANLTPYVQDKTLILVTQKMNLLSMVERVIVMHESKVYLDDTKEVVLKKLGGEQNG
jgi:ATP-binding cassette subfamily C protein LapB